MTKSNTVIITMAGEGQRFRAAGYSVPKYEVEVRGKTLFAWAVDSLQNMLTSDSHVVFIARKTFQPEAFIAKECEKLGIQQFDVVLLEQLTDGQATTVLHAKQAPINMENPVLIYNIDTHVTPQCLTPENNRGDGWIPCFPGKGTGWSFVRIDEAGLAVEVREKKRISSHATIGLYGFSSFTTYEMVYHHYYSNPDNVECQERYIAPLYNEMIREGGQVYISELPEDAVFPLGTPDEVEVFRHGQSVSQAATG